MGSSGSSEQADALRSEINQTQVRVKTVRQECKSQRETLASVQRETEGIDVIRQQLTALQRTLETVQHEVLKGETLIDRAAEEDLKTAKLRGVRITHTNRTELRERTIGGGYYEKVIESENKKDIESENKKDIESESAKIKALRTELRNA